MYHSVWKDWLYRKHRKDRQETQKFTVLLTERYNCIIEEDNIYDTKKFARIRTKQVTSCIKVYPITSVCRDWASQWNLRRSSSGQIFEARIFLVRITLVRTGAWKSGTVWERWINMAVMKKIWSRDVGKVVCFRHRAHTFNLVN